MRYRLPKEHIPTFKEFAIQRMLRGRMEYHNFFALEDVSLEVRRGEVLGIVGANGAGKSTLLKVIARVIPPTQGGCGCGGASRHCSNSARASILS